MTTRIRQVRKHTRAYEVLAAIHAQREYAPLSTDDICWYTDLSREIVAPVISHLRQARLVYRDRLQCTYEGQAALDRIAHDTVDIEQAETGTDADMPTSDEAAAYWLRCPPEPGSWAAIAEAIGYADGREAFMAAESYAHRHGLSVVG